MNCPERKAFCPCPEFSKEGICDWPYRNGMSLQEARYMTEILRVIDGTCMPLNQGVSKWRKQEAR